MQGNNVIFIGRLTEWNQRMDEANRLVYQIDELQNIKVISCRGHYEE